VGDSFHAAIHKRLMVEMSKALGRGNSVLEDLKDIMEAGQLNDGTNSILQRGQPDIPTRPIDGTVGRNQNTQSGAIDKIDFRKINDQFVLVISNERLDLFFQLWRRRGIQATFQLQDNHIADLFIGYEHIVSPLVDGNIIQWFPYGLCCLLGAGKVPDHKWGIFKWPSGKWRVRLSPKLAIMVHLSRIYALRQG